MGGFFLSNSDAATERAAKFFSALDLPFQTVSMGGFRLLLLRKKYVRDHRNYFETADGNIAGVGVWMTDKGFGHAALADVLDSVLHKPKALGELAGHAAFIVHRSGQVSIITDKTGTYPVYTAADASGSHYSSSLLALAEATENLTFNRQALLEFINVEAFLGNETLFENIKSLPYGAIFRVTPSSGGIGSIDRYYRPTDSVGSIPELLDNERAHVARLNAAGLGAGELCCDLSGGARLSHCSGRAPLLANSAYLEHERKSRRP